MSIKSAIWRTSAALWIACTMAGTGHAEDVISDLPPYKLVRSLEYVQDTIARGDLSALDMQKYLLSAIDARLRKATSKDFDDHRNVNAALIYAMSGGNSDTLANLVFNDAAGHFDIRVTEALRMYLNGKGDAAVKRLEEMVPEYKSSEIGPYLALVAANSIGTTSPKDALKYLDWARLVSPGTIIEETAIRRSVVYSINAELYDKAIAYSKRYARRFTLSPYAGQFADIFVNLAVEHDDHVTTEAVKDVLSQMEASRQREVYLRIARKSAILGKLGLVKFSTDEAKQLLEPKSENSAILADLFSGLAEIPSSNVLEALNRVASIPDDKLSEKDRNLRDAAKFIGYQVLSPPVSASLTQAEDATVPANDGSQIGEISTDNPTAPAPSGAQTDPLASPQAPPPPKDASAPGNQSGKQPPPAADAATKQDASPPSEIDTFVTSERAKLDEIDAMLQKAR